MSQIKQLGSGAIWICESCNIWWGSQIGKHPTTTFLIQLDKVGLLPSWDSFRGCKLVAEEASICLECGTLITQPALLSN